VPSRQDQLHSYQYSLQRVVAALVTHDPDPHRSPLRRAGTTALISLVIAALLVSAAAIYGILTGTGSGDPTDESVVYMEKGTGARYVFLKSDNKIHPVLNYASGLLIANGSAPKLVNTSRQKLATVDLGEPLGIAGAPDSLPPADDLVKGVWTVCSRQPDAGAGSAGGPQSVLLVGDRVTDGTVLPETQVGSAASALRALLVADSAGRTFAVYNNRRFLIPGGRVQQTRTWFGWADQPLRVATAWINAVPAGPDLRQPIITDRGEPSGKVDDYDIGQILRIPGESNAPARWGVVLADGVSDITDVQALLMRSDPATPEPKTIDRNGYGALPASERLLIGEATTAGFPPTVPALLSGANKVCLTFTDEANGRLSIRVNATVPTGTPTAADDAAVPGGVLADAVQVPRGKGALVSAVASPSAPSGSGTLTLITDTGRSYPIATPDVQAKLGYGGERPARIPAQMVALLPQGPALDATRARRSTSDGQ
jgi:type VII secretion protein EccB